jgi:hypothetical protein
MDNEECNGWPFDMRVIDALASAPEPVVIQRPWKGAS